MNNKKKKPLVLFIILATFFAIASVIVSILYVQKQSEIYSLTEEKEHLEHDHEELMHDYEVLKDTEEVLMHAWVVYCGNVIGLSSSDECLALISRLNITYENRINNK